MLITLPLAAGIVLSARELGLDGKAKNLYQPITEGSTKLVLRPVVPRTWSLTKNGATALPSTPKAAVWMMVSSLTYLIIQIPAFYYIYDTDYTDNEQAEHEKIWYV